MNIILVAIMLVVFLLSTLIGFKIVDFWSLDNIVKVKTDYDARHDAWEVDRYGFIVPQATWRDSGNPMIYSTLHLVLNGMDGARVIRLKRLWLADKKLLLRTPNNEYGQNSHDEYSALALLCLLTKDKELAQDVLIGMLMRGGFMYNAYGGFWKSQLFRFPQIMLALIGASTDFKPLRWVMGQMIRVISWTAKLEPGNASGVQLTFLLHLTVEQLVGDDSSMRAYLQRLKQFGGIGVVMQPYYSQGHSMVEGYKRYELLRN